jgi:hypothetical protein
VQKAAANCGAKSHDAIVANGPREVLTGV